MHPIGTQTIETPRLNLRPFRASDAPAMFRNWAGDPAVTEYVTWPTHASVEETAGIVETWVRQTAEDPSFYQWAIELKSLGEPIGSIAVAHLSADVESAELGWCLGRAWWGRGIMPEAAEAVIAYLFERAGFNRVAARYDTRNAKSGRVMEKLGMIREGVLRQAGHCNAGVCDEAVYSILRSEYDARCNPAKGE
jgi:RimJ/RimL family protein N-acetyltransferase